MPIPQKQTQFRFFCKPSLAVGKGWLLLFFTIGLILFEAVSPFDIADTQPYAHWGTIGMLVVLLYASIFSTAELQAQPRRLIFSWRFLNLVPVWFRSWNLSDDEYVTIVVKPYFEAGNGFSLRPKVAGYTHVVTVKTLENKELKLREYYSRELCQSSEAVEMAKRIAKHLSLPLRIEDYLNTYKAEVESRHVSLWVNWLIIVAFGGGGIFFLISGVSQTIHEFKTNSWPSTKATVVSCNMQFGRNSGPLVPTIVYKYNVEKTEYLSSPKSIPKGLIKGAFSHASALKQFHQGRIFDVYFNPESPIESILEAGIRWTGLAVVLIICIPFIALALFVLYGTVKYRHENSSLNTKVTS